MRAFVHFAQVGATHMGITLGVRNRRMPQEFLNRPEIRAPFQKMSGKTMPEHMG